MVWCWQQSPDDRPTAKQIVATVDTDQFLRLLDGIRVCDNTHIIACCYRVVSAYSRNTPGQRGGVGRRSSPTTVVSPLVRPREEKGSFDVSTEGGNRHTKLSSLSEEGGDPLKFKGGATEDEVGGATGQEGMGGATGQEGMGGATGQKGMGGATGQEGMGGTTELEEAITPEVMEPLQSLSHNDVTNNSKHPSYDEVRPKHPYNSDDVISGPSPYENSSPPSQYGDDDVICELWVASSDGHHSIATVIDFTGRFVNTEVSVAMTIHYIVMFAHTSLTGH